MAYSKYSLFKLVPSVIFAGLDPVVPAFIDGDCGRAEQNPLVALLRSAHTQTICVLAVTSADLILQTSLFDGVGVDDGGGGSGPSALQCLTMSPVSGFPIYIVYR